MRESAARKKLGNKQRCDGRIRVAPAAAALRTTKSTNDTKAVASRRRLLLTVATGWLVGANWLIFIWAVLRGRITLENLHDQEGGY